LVGSSCSALIVASLVLFSAAIASAGAVPETRRDKPLDRKERHRCLTRAEAEDLRDLWISFFVKISDGGAEARKSVTDDFKLFSESTNAVTPGRNLPIDAPQYDGKEAFVQGQIAATSSTPPPNFSVIAWDYGCDTFTFRWRGDFVPGQLGVAGIDFVFVQQGSYLLEKAYSEWNNVHFLSEIGCKLVGGACGTHECGVCSAPQARDIFA